MLNEMLIDLKFSRTKGKWWDFECVLARIEKKIGGLIGGPFWFTRINKRLRGGRWRGGLLGTKGINGETGGVDVPTRTGLRVVYLDTDAKTNGTIKLNSSQTPVARLSSSLASRDSPALDRENAIPTYVCTRVCVCVHTIVSQLARVSPLLNRVSIRSSKFSHDLYILIEIIHRTAATLKKIRDKSHRLGLETRASVVGFKIP